MANNVAAVTVVNPMSFCPIIPATSQCFVLKCKLKKEKRKKKKTLINNEFGAENCVVRVHVK